jgi:hypothetical protein
MSGTERTASARRMATAATPSDFMAGKLGRRRPAWRTGGLAGANAFCNSVAAAGGVPAGSPHPWNVDRHHARNPSALSVDDFFTHLAIGRRVFDLVWRE